MLYYIEEMFTYYYFNDNILSIYISNICKVRDSNPDHHKKKKYYQYILGKFIESTQAIRNTSLPRLSSLTT
jgi:hypothetical protein